MPDQPVVEELLEKGARAMALVDDENGCFERVAEWEAMEPWEQESEGQPHNDREDCEYWRKRAAAALDAVFPGWREGITREWRVAHRDGGYVNGVTGPQLAERFAAKCPTSECVVESRLLGPWVPVEEGTT